MVKKSHLLYYTTPSSLLSYCCLKKETSSVEDSRRQFIDFAGQQPNLFLETASYVVHLLLSPSTKIGTDSTGKITVVLHGEIYNATNNQPAYIAEKLQHGGDTCIQDINGTYAILLVDQQADKVAVITDRINSHRIFYSQYEAGWCISSQLSTQPWQSFKLDPTGIAHYLANGVIHNYRTLWDGLSVFEQACIHQLTREGFKAKKYWTYQFNSSAGNISEKTLAAELLERLIQSVRRRLYDNPDLFLSLSAGYDATGLLGILAFDIQIPQVHCFSYAHDVPQPKSDAYLAMLAAKSAGYSHEMVESYTGNLIDHILDNARMGQGFSNHCDEVSAWKTLAPKFSAVERPVLFVGDECLGWNDYYLRSQSDVLASVGILGFERLSWLKPILPDGTYEKFQNGLAEDMKRIASSCPTTADWHDAKDFLYLNQRLANFIMPWRDNFAGQFVMVRNPLLDNDILDFMMTVPSSLRRGKRLYRQTITKMYPKLFRLPRASYGGYSVDWVNEFRHHAVIIQELIEQHKSKLDEIIPSDVLLKVLNKVLHNSSSAQFQKSKVASWVPKSIKDQLKSYLPPQSSPVNPTTLLMRLLILKAALSRGNYS
jgi:asparagine synthase (glutamine-hydrolysing)